MSDDALLYSEAMTLWFAQFAAARGLGQKAAAALKFRPSFLAPVIAIMKGLTDPNVGLLMGQTAENLAHRPAGLGVVLEVLLEVMQVGLDLLRRVQAPQKRVVPSRQAEIGRPGKTLGRHHAKKI